MTLLAEKQPFAQVMNDLAPQLGVSVIVGGIEGDVTCSFEDADGEQVVRSLAAQVKAVPSLTGGVLSFKRSGDGAEVFGMFYPAYDMPKDMVEGLKAVLPKESEVRDVGGRILVAGDKDAVLRAGDVMRHAEAAGPDGWLLQVSLVGVSRSLRQELGLSWSVVGAGHLGMDAKTGASAAKDAAGAAASGSLPVFGARAAAAVDVLARASESGNEAVTLTTGTLLLLEGGEANFQQGEDVPIARTSISPEGTVTTVGYDVVSTGFQVTAKGRRVPDGLFLELEPSLSGVSGYVGEHPIIAQRRVKGACVVRSGEWMILSGLEAADWSRDGDSLPGMPSRRLFGTERESTAGRSLVVLVRADRVYGSGQAHN